MLIPDLGKPQFIDMDAKQIILTRKQFDNIHNHYKQQIEKLKKELKTICELRNKLIDEHKQSSMPPWAKDTQKNIKEHGSYADFVAWENWFKNFDDEDMLEILDDDNIANRSYLYSIFCECYPDYKWE
jgi:hypothetical protein